MELTWTWTILDLGFLRGSCWTSGVFSVAMDSQGPCGEIAMDPWDPMGLAQAWTSWNIYQHLLHKDPVLIGRYSIYGASGDDQIVFIDTSIRIFPEYQKNDFFKIIIPSFPMMWLGNSDYIPINIPHKITICHKKATVFTKNATSCYWNLFFFHN